MNSRKAACSVILAGILWGIISLFIKQLSAAGFDSMEISLIRMIVAAPVFTIFLLITDRQKLKISLKDLWMFIGTGIISVVVFNVCYFYTMINSEASVAVVLLYTSPVFIIILSAIFFKEKITPVKLCALVLTFAGCVLVAGLIGSGYKVTPLILATGLGSGLAYGLYTIFGRVALKKYDAITVTVYTFIFGLIGSLFVGRPAEVFSIVSADPKVILWCLAIGIFSTVLPYFLYTRGLQKMESGKAAILVAVEPLVGAVIGMTVFKESHSVLKITGIVLILAAITILSIPEKKKQTDIK